MTNVRKVFNKRNVAGEVGIELEFEGRRLPASGFEDYWSKQADGSLRGESAEYVLRKPIPRDEVKKALDVLDKTFKDNATLIHDTFRAGTHIHINVQELTMPQVLNMLTIYFMFESLLIKLCREDRVGNHFCLRGRDAAAMFDLLYKAVAKGHVQEFTNDMYRYAAVNITALPKFGSLEFRALESSTNWAKLEAWIALHLALKDAAKKFQDPATILGTASVQGFKSFAESVFGEHWPLLVKLYDEQEVAEGVWAIQPVVFSKNWDSVNNNIFAVSNIFDITP